MTKSSNKTAAEEIDRANRRAAWERHLAHRKVLERRRQWKEEERQRALSRPYLLAPPESPWFHHTFTFLAPVLIAGACALVLFAVVFYDHFP